MPIETKFARFFSAVKNNLAFTKPSKTRSAAHLTLLTISIWAIIVVITITCHEYWRDEIRAYSYAREASSITELVANLENDGHPMLWHLLLYIGDAITSSRYVLPVLSFLISLAAVLLLLYRSPFHFWFKLLVTFSSLPLYEYSVMARNYGISMLLFFAFAATYRSRQKHPILLGTILGLLCNTNIHSALLACLLTSVWIYDSIFAEISIPAGSKVRNNHTGVYTGIIVMLSGMATALYVVWPTEILDASHVTDTTAHAVVNAFIETISSYSGAFASILYPFPYQLVNITLLSCILGLIARAQLMVAALTGLIALNMFSLVVYPMDIRHQGLFIIFLISLYWIALDAGIQQDRRRVPEALFRLGYYIVLPVILVTLVYRGIGQIDIDIRHEMSANKKMAAFLHHHKEYADAVIIGEPDFNLESLPYYANNRLFIVREDRFGSTVRLTDKSKHDLSLGDILCAARHVAWDQHSPVIIAIGHKDFGKVPEKTVKYSYVRTFSWSPHEIELFRQTTKYLKSFNNTIQGEDYSVYQFMNHASSLDTYCHDIKAITPR